MANFTITGVKEIQHAFRVLPKRVASKLVRQAIRKALKPIKREAEQRAPKGATGLLSKSIKIRARKKQKRGVIAIDVQTGEGNFKGETFYGGFQELGTKKIEAKNYMGEAFDAKKESAAEQVANEIAGGIVREAIAAAK